MEADERPTKKRRLSKDEQPATSDLTQENPHTNEDHAKKPIGEDGIDKTASHGSPDVLPIPTDTAPVSTAPEPPVDSQPLSKNQLKKLRKKQEWESKRPERRAIRKQKAHEKKQRKREQHKLAAQNGESKAGPDKSIFHKGIQLPVTFLIDCDFDDLMRDNERISLAGQLTRSYSDNRKAPFRAHLAVCSFAGKLRQRFDEVLTHYKGWRDVRFLDCDFVEAAEKAKEWMATTNGGTLAGAFSTLATESEGVASDTQEAGEVVYLTSESDNILEELKPYSTYIIGGLVDKNREKGICYERATKRGVKTAKLPVREFMDMQSRQVLATNHVNEIMLRWLECGDWGEAFLKVIPKRKDAKLKGRGEAEEDGDDEESGVAKEGSNSEQDGADEADEAEIEGKREEVDSLAEGIP